MDYLPFLADLSTLYVLFAIFRDPDYPMRRSDLTIHPDSVMQLLSGPYNDTRNSRSSCTIVCTYIKPRI
jgi:hypothetical protein